MIRWEYLTVMFDLIQPLLATPRVDQTLLNQCLFNAGADGWELVQTESINLNGRTNHLLLIFKRPQPEPQIPLPPLPNQ